MIKKLKSLVFGFADYEKVKIDKRFQQIYEIIDDIQIKNIEDFEILENVIFKIKELLRIKSSNLNTIIKKQNNLSKKKVEYILNKLNDIKYDFLKKAFEVIDEEKNNNTSISEEDDVKINTGEENKENINDNNKNYKENIQSDNVEIDREQKEPTQEQINKILEDKNYKVTMENGKVPYMLINFKNEINYNILKNLSIILFDQYQAEGTNIIIENNKALIIPRFNNDNLFELPRVKTDIESVFSEIEKNKNVKDVEYKQIETPKEEFSKSSKNDDKSLDALLSGEEEKKITPKPDPQKDKSKIEKIESEPVEIEKKEKKIKDEIQIEKQEPKQEQPIKEKEIEKKEFEIYRDDKILVYINPESKVEGELIIESINQKNIEEIEDEIFTYMFIFSKIFGAVLFETKSAHGTNIIFNYSENKIRIIPRYQDDQLNINWQGSQQTDEYLDNIKDKLLSAMSNALEDNKDDKTSETKEETTDKENNSSKQEKAEYILKSLKRIP